jgi:hypothetical protein
MPFTLAHSAAALPFRKLRVVPSAIVIGTFAPDFEYFLRLGPHGHFGHTLTGAVVFTFPIALAVLWMFHAFVKRPVAALLPDGLRSRLAGHLSKFEFFGPARFLWIVVSILLGIATHLVWDSFTHANTWPYHHWPRLHETVRFPAVGPVAYYKILQHGSTVVGTLIVFAWLVRWYRESKPQTTASAKLPVPKSWLAILAVVILVACAGGLIRATAGRGFSTSATTPKRFIGELVVTAIALAWWQLVAYGIFLSTRPSSIQTTRQLDSES